MENRLTIPVNPKYDFDLDPAEQEGTYVNPVTLNNSLIRYANTAATLVQQLTVAKKERLETNLRIRAAKQQLDDLEYDLLMETPKAAKQTLKIQETEIRRKAKELGSYDYMKELENDLHKLTDSKLILDVKIENLVSALDLVEQLSQNVQTHLSFIKTEMRQSRNY